MKRPDARPLCCALTAVLLSVTGCETGPTPDGGADNPPAQGNTNTTTRDAPAPSLTTAAVDAFDDVFARGVADEERRSALLLQRWAAVKRAVAAAGADHEGAFYASRGYWHTGFLRGGGWSWEQQGDLDEPIVVDGRGRVIIHGHCNGNITINDDAVVHILGDLNATLDLRGAAEVIVAGNINPAGNIQTTGTLDLYTGGGVSGRIAAAGSGVLVIDGPLIGNFAAGQPVTALHITGDCAGQVTAPDDAAALLTLRVDGYMPQAALRATLASGFTRLTASIGQSDTQPGLYPNETSTDAASRPTSRWVIHERAMR